MLTWNFLWDCTPRHLDTSGLGWLVSCGPKIRGKPQHYLQSNESQIFRTLGVGIVIATVHKAIQHSLVRLAFFMVINKSLSANTVLAKETQHETKTKSTALDSLQMVSKAPDLSHRTPERNNFSNFHNFFVEFSYFPLMKKSSTYIQSYISNWIIT